MNEQYFEYGKKEINYLKKVDSRMKLLIQHYGMVERRMIPDLYNALIHTVIGQLISIKAADSIFEKLNVFCDGLSARNIVKYSIEDIQGVGLTKRKAETIYEISKKVSENVLDLTTFHQKKDNEIVKELCQIKGVGEWTAQIFLIHALQRRDIISYKDLAIRKGLCRLYGLEEISVKQFEQYEKQYSPYATIASFYLWKLAHEKDAEVLCG